jgi:serine/threonine-protein phosphatase 2B catalytic subunit
MENEAPPVDPVQYTDQAVRAIQQKGPVPEIDFSLHTMEDGTQVSTQERVCKGKLGLHPPPLVLARRPGAVKRFRG